MKLTHPAFATRLTLFTRDPSKASAFIIPFDAGVHSYIDHKTGKPRLASPHGWTAIALLQQASRNEVRLFYFVTYLDLSL